MARYVLCPRCELNFIDADKDEYCEVCVKELKGEKTISDDFELEEGLEETELCPICGENYMVFGEKVCEECKKKSEYQEEEEELEDEDKDDASWRSYLDDEEPEDLGINIPDEEFDDEVEEEEEEEEYAEEEFEYVSADDYNADEDDEEDDEEDEDF